MNRKVTDTPDGVLVHADGCGDDPRQPSCMDHGCALITRVGPKRLKAVRLGYEPMFARDLDTAIARVDEAMDREREYAAMVPLYDGRDGCIEVPEEERCKSCGADWCDCTQPTNKES